MSGNQGVVALDVGNSAVKAVFRTRDQQLIRWASRLTEPDWPIRCVRWASRQLGGTSFEWRVASVNRAAVRQFQDAAAEFPESMSVLLVAHRHVPMPTKVDQPDRLGIDRLLGAWGAHCEFPESLVVIDVGSAITIDRVDVDSTFLGGAILPGIMLQIAALGSGTDALPVVEWHPNQPLRVPATNTEDAIRLGVFAGVAGSIDRIIELYRRSDRTLDKAIRDKPGRSRVLADEQDAAVSRVVLTGGDAAAIGPLLRHAHEHRPDLICRALLDLPRLELVEPFT